MAEFKELKFDPINPPHYAGTACAEIGERLSANSYQVLKYCWRLGRKDEDRIELGKAVWYLKRELNLHFSGQNPRPIQFPQEGFFHARLAGQSQFVLDVAWA